jgi:hypothetical protein
VRAAIGLLLATACGRIDFDTNSDAAITCTAFGAWGAPEPISELNTKDNDWGGQITPDGLVYYYEITVAGAGHFYVARRPHRASAFDPAVEITELTDTTAGDVSTTGDELEMYFEAGTGNATCVYESVRSSKTEKWGTPVELSQLCTTASSYCPYISGDGLSLYYFDHSTNLIAETTRASRSDPWTAGTDLQGLFTGLNCPAMSGDQLTMYYGGGGPVTLYSSTRPTLTAPFQPQMVVFGVGTADDTDVSITADGTEIFFASDRPGVGGWDLYHATRPCL